MKENTIVNSRRALALLEGHGLDTIENLSFSSYGKSARFSCSRDYLNDEHMREIKRLFGPLKLKDDYQGKSLEGEMNFDEGFRVRFIVEGAYICEKLDPKDLTEEKVSDIISKIKEGLVEVKDCNPVNGKPLEEDL